MCLYSSFFQINWFAVVLCLVLSFVLGAVWHSVLFNKAWSQDSGSIYTKGNHGNPFVIFGLSALLHALLIIGLAIFVGQHSNFVDGTLKGIFVSVIWIATSMGVTYIFVGRTFRLFLIDAGFYVVFMAIVGMILGAWS